MMKVRTYAQGWFSLEVALSVRSPYRSRYPSTFHRGAPSWKSSALVLINFPGMLTSEMRAHVKKYTVFSFSA